MDPADLEATSERPAVLSSRAQRVARVRMPIPTPTPTLATTDEVAAADILSEAWVEPPGASAMPVARTLPDLLELEEDESVPTDGRVVDQLLREADATRPAWISPVPPSVASARDVPSVAPVALEAVRTAPLPPYSFRAPIPRPQPLILPPRRLTPARGAMLLLVGITCGAAIAFVASPSGVLRAVFSPRTAVSSTEAPSPAATTATTTATATPPPVAPAAPAAVPVADSHRDAVPVDALPAPQIDPDMTYVTFAGSAKGHRIYVDRVLVSSDESPVKIKCGLRKIRIGSAGRPRNVELPCGRAVTLR